MSETSNLFPPARHLGAIAIVRPTPGVPPVPVTMAMLVQADQEDRAFIRDNQERQARMLESPLLRSISL